MDLRDEKSSFLSALTETRLCSTITVPRFRLECCERAGDDDDGEWGDPLEGEWRDVIPVQPVGYLYRVCVCVCGWGGIVNVKKMQLQYRIAGYFRGVYISRNSQFNSCSRKVISRMEILNRASSTFKIFIFEDWLCFREIREI